MQCSAGPNKFIGAVVVSMYDYCGAEPVPFNRAPGPPAAYRDYAVFLVFVQVRVSQFEGFVCKLYSLLVCI